MKTIEVDDEVFAALLRKVVDFGDTPNLVLRRLLIEGATNTEKLTSSSPIKEFLKTREFRLARGAVGRFLAILSWLYLQNKTAFTCVEDIKGRGRLYFSKSVEELENSGRSVNPKKIPGSPYWVITTTPTNLKQEMLQEVMGLLEYDTHSIQTAKAAIAQ
jgi:negative modulator of initiation of replication